MQCQIQLRKIFNLLLLAIVFAVILSSCKKDITSDKFDDKLPAAVTELKETKDLKFTNNYFILPGDGALPAEINDKIRGANGIAIESIPALEIVMASSTDPDFKTKMEQVAGVGEVLRDVKLQYLREPHYNRLQESSTSKTKTGNSNPLYSLQWNMDAIEADKAWTKGYTGSGAKVAVLDNGFELSHPDLVGRIMPSSKNFVAGETLQFQQNPAFPGDQNAFWFSHATHVTGIIAANDNNIGVIGVAPKARIIAVKVLSDDGFGSFADVMKGIVYAADTDADIINMSLGAYIPASEANIPELIRLIIQMQRAVNYATQKGVTIIAAAGNEGINRDAAVDIELPADLINVEAISATGPLGWFLNPNTNLDVPAFYTNFGLSAIDLAAPGGNIDFSLIPDGPFYYDMVLSTANDGDYFFAAGTSMAAPHASGVAALIVSKYGHLQPAQLRAKLHQSADDLGAKGKDAYYGYGRVNAKNAVK